MDRKNLNMNDKIILTDVDGVVLYWEQHFHNWMNKRGHNVVKTGIYDICESYGVATAKAESLVEEFNTSSYMIDIPPFRDSLSGIAKLKENGYKFIAITKVGGDHNTKRLRAINLKDLYGNDTFIELHCLPDSESKKPFLEPYKDSGLYWIEDVFKNAVIGADLGLKPIILNHAYNEDFYDHRIIRVDTWAQICQIILD